MWRTQLHKGGSHEQETQLRHHGIASHKVVEPWGRQETWDSRRDTCGRRGCCVQGEMRQCLWEVPYSIRGGAEEKQVPGPKGRGTA